MYDDDLVYDFDAPDSDWNYEPSRGELFRQLDSAVYTTDADGYLTYYNEAAAKLWGRRPVLGVERWCGSWRIYRPDGTPLPLDQCPMAVAMKEGRPVRGEQAVIERPDGTRVAFMPYPTPLRDASGHIVAGSNVLLEIHQPRPVPLGRSGAPRLRESALC
ncbi:MAG TPA: PAS domain-containing protein [Methylobacterium sp.]|jgi:PAS domain-containing protein|nr:PAS domain-containing protein [Methylobacterium sp.]